MIRYFSQSVFRRNTLEDILWDIASNCIRELHFEDCVIYLADHERNVLVQKAAYGPKNIDNVQIADPIEIPFGKGIVGATALSRLPEIVADCTTDPRYIVDDAVRQSEMSVPILFEGQLLGVIDSEHSHKGFYTEEHLDILEGIASIASTKIANTLAQEELSDHARFFDENPMPVLRIDADGRVLEHNKASEGVLEHWGISGRFPKGGTVLSLVQESIKRDQEVTDQLHYEGRTYSLLFAPVAERSYCNIFISDVSEITEARNQAEAANQAKDDFLSVVSHEMRTPVNAIIGLMSLLEKSGIREDQKQYADSLNFASKNLLNLINDILDFAKAESGNLRLEERPFELRTLVQSAVSALRGRASSNGILLNTEISDDVPQLVLGDELRLLQILNNLLQNALKFTQNGRVTMRVTEMRRTSSGISRLHFAVQDTGIGISQEAQAHIFEPFSQANPGTSRQYGGTGLGLAIVGQLLEQHRSELRLESEEGKGSTFSFALDYPVVEQTTSALEGTPDDLDDRFASRRFLVVDDNDINRMICEEFIQQWGGVAVSAEHGGKAVEAFVDGKFDVILMDLQMPICDGIEATRRIRQLSPASPGSPDYVPILMVTADVFLKRREEAEQAGVDAFLTKPFGMEDLQVKVAELWQKSEA